MISKLQQPSAPAGGRKGTAATQVFAVMALWGAVLSPATGNEHSSTVGVSLSAAEELVVDGVRDLDFGSLLIGSGVTSVAVTDPGAGLFSISGASNRRVRVTLSPPSVLTNGNGDSIVLTSGAAYNNLGPAASDPSGAIAFTGNTASFHIDATGVAPPKQSTAYVWIYGDLDVGNVPPGNYTAIYTLTAEYIAAGGPPPGGGGGP